MHRYQQIRFCPHCGNPYGPTAFDPLEVCFHCTVCAFPFYQNSVPSTSTVIPSKKLPGKILLITRAISPHRGKLCLPGGFLGYHEAPEAAAQREAQEETRLDIRIDRLLAAYLVEYCFHSAQLSILELSFLATPLDVTSVDYRTQEASHMAFYDVSWVIQNSALLAFPEQGVSVKRYAETI